MRYGDGLALYANLQVAAAIFFSSAPDKNQPVNEIYGVERENV